MQHIQQPTQPFSPDQSSMTSEGFVLMAKYNCWMNTQLFEAAATLDSAVLQADLGAFFKSIINSLNHILLCDTLWLQRFAGHAAQFKSLDAVAALPKPQHLDQVIYLDFEYLWLARKHMDRTISAFCAELSNAALAQPLRFETTGGTPTRMNFAALLQHFFNHQTHHRGQVTTLLSQQGLDVGVTDLLALIPDTYNQAAESMPPFAQ